MKRVRTSIMRAVLPGLLVGGLLCLAMGAAKAPDQGLGSLLPPGLQRWLEAAPGEEQATANADLHISPHMVDTSLEVRECIDFLHTPALLVQEAVSDGVILTYPEE